MDQTKAKREDRCNEEIWEYLHIPKPFQKPGSIEFWKDFINIKKSCSLIHKDQVIIRKLGKRDQELSISSPDGKMVQVSDPVFYL